MGNQEGKGHKKSGEKANLENYNSQSNNDCTKNFQYSHKQSYNINSNPSNSTQQEQTNQMHKSQINTNIPVENNSSANQDCPQQTENINYYQPQRNNENPYMPYMNKAYQLFVEAGVLSKQFSFYEALFKYEEAQKLTTTIYYKIAEDEQLKLKVDHFLKNINSQIDFVNFQIKNQFSFKEKAGFASKEAENKKVDYLESLRKNNFDEGGRAGVVEQPRSRDVSENSAKNKNNNSSIDKSANQNSNKTEKDSQIVSNDLKSKILAEIVDSKPGIKFADVIGLDQAKQILKEIIVLPSLRPDLFTGLRSPPRGLLLFGPPGVGKTMIAKAVATECQCTFFSISASSLTSKYVGESEKLVRALFDLAFEKQPSVVFIDEIESILSKRSDGENEATKRLKTEFLVQFDGVGSDQTARILIIGATNRPQELDSAVLRRLPKRVYINPFNQQERKVFIQSLMKENEHHIAKEEYEYIAKLTNNYSNSDLKELCREAAYEPIRELDDLTNITKLRPTVYDDFLKATKKVRGTLNDTMLSELENWNQLYGAIS